MVADLRHVWRAKPVVSGVLLHAERAGRFGLSALVGYAARCVPWSTLIALRFARLRRSLLYGVRGGGTVCRRVEPQQPPRLLRKPKGLRADLHGRTARPDLRSICIRQER
jgi:hypothetical protein